MTAIVYKTREEKSSARRKMLEAKLELEKKIREKMSNINW